MILTCFLAHPLFCPYWTISAKYGIYALRVQIESRSAKAWFCSRKKFKRTGFPQKSRSEFCGKRSSEHRSKAARNEAACEICSAATRRRETLLGSVILEAKAAFISLPPSVREVPRRGGRSHLILGAFLRGEQVLSCEEPGVALTTCELENGALFGAFPDRGGVSLAPPRRWLAKPSLI